MVFGSMLSTDLFLYNVRFFFLLSGRRRLRDRAAVSHVKLPVSSGSSCPPWSREQKTEDTSSDRTVISRPPGCSNTTPASQLRNGPTSCANSRIQTAHPHPIIHLAATVQYYSQCPQCPTYLSYNCIGFPFSST